MRCRYRSRGNRGGCRNRSSSRSSGGGAAVLLDELLKGTLAVEVPRRRLHLAQSSELRRLLAQAGELPRVSLDLQAPCRQAGRLRRGRVSITGSRGRVASAIAQSTHLHLVLLLCTLRIHDQRPKGSAQLLQVR